jgi:hypothetical protein
MFPHPNQSMESCPLPFAKSVRFLRMTLDSHLALELRLQQLWSKCQQTVNILGILIGASWGTDRTVKRHQYEGLMSWLWNFYLWFALLLIKKVSVCDPIHHSGMCLTTSTFQTTRVESLQSQGKLHLPFGGKSSCVVTPQNWALSRNFPPVEQYTSSLTKQDTCPIPKQ